MIQDLQYALRFIRKSPWAAIIAVLPVAIGVGANSAIFSLQDLPCAVTPTEALLPHIVGDAAGGDPAWVVSGSQFDSRGVKTLWIFKTRNRVRVTGRDVATGAVVRFRRDGLDGPVEDEMVIDNPRRQSVLPGGATRELLDTYAFITSAVLYPDHGCYRFDVDIEGIARHITIRIR